MTHGTADAIARCERASAYFRHLVMTGELSYFMPPDPTQDERVLDMTMAAVALADWEMERELLSRAETEAISA